MNEPTDNIVNEFKREEESTTKKISRNISSRQLLTFLGIAIAWIYCYSISLFSKSLMWIVAVIIGVVIFIMMKKEDADPSDLLPPEVAYALLDSDLKKQQLVFNRLPPGKIIINPSYELRSFEGSPIKYCWGFNVLESDGYESSWVGEIKAIGKHKGFITAIKEYPEGFKGREPDDVRYILPKEFGWEQKYFRRRAK